MPQTIVDLTKDWYSFSSTIILYTFFQILRIGFYEILKLEMPPYAVVDEVRGCIKSQLKFSRF